MSVLKACKKCGYVTEEDTCPICGSPTSREWQGYLVVIDHNKSKIAQLMGIATNGKFALRVR